jgi:penicillin-binding protein 2
MPSTRGVIFDRDGRALVSNTASYSVKIRPSDLPESRRTEVVNALAALVGMDPADINVALDSNPGSRYDPVRVAQDVEPEVAGFIAESKAQLPGVEVVVETRRSYELGALVSQVLGYTGPISGEELAATSAPCCPTRPRCWRPPRSSSTTASRCSRTRTTTRSSRAGSRTSAAPR